MHLEYRSGPCHDLAAYASIPIAYSADRIFDVDLGDSGGPVLHEVVVPPFTKDYDAEEGHAPTDWPRRFDVASWRVFTAWGDGRPLGGAAVVHGSPEIDLLEGRSDLALLWDVRVHPDARGLGIGRGLVRRAEGWAATRGCSELKVETQNVNPAACRFYQACGFSLRAALPGVYPDFPDEIMLLWYKPLSGPGEAPWR